ncbi:MAG: hypothetical protein WBG92_16170, partial [Thiohalocapsa sp.]
FQLVPAFRLGQTAGLKVLTDAVTSRPELFAELIRLIYPPETKEPSDDPPSDGQRIAAENARQLLRDCRRQPGTLPDGQIDPATCLRFVDDALALCREQDRLTKGQQTIGQLLAHAPEGEDGIWPGLPARDILNRRDCEQMRSGFQIGIINKRGMTSRAMDEGGTQERALAATHPFLSATLDGIARSYDADAQREDDQAALNRERY